jgi:hypothetical protein
MTGLYIDDGKIISTHSMLKTFRRCPKQAEYKYVHRLKPKLMGKPLHRGSWLHTLLEYYHSPEKGDWREEHQKLAAQFADLFDEEREYYGDLPTECMSIMLSYIWHYKNDPWKVHETEFTLETEFPDGSVYRGKVDALIENRFGLWLVDHKSHQTLPDHNFRLLDAQSGLYLWAALRNKIPVQGFIWNYLRTKPPTKPKLAYAGTAKQRLSLGAIDTDYPTYKAEVLRLKSEEGLRITPDINAKLKQLASHRYRPDEAQISTFFRRDTLEKSNDMLKRVATENFRTSKRMHSYDFSNPDAVERVVERGCTFSCSYTDICTVELMGGNTRPLLKQNYRVGDPMDYYQDRAGDNTRKEA